MKVLSLVNAYCCFLDYYYYYFSIVQALQNSQNFSNLLSNKSLLKVCNEKAATSRSCCFRFRNASFGLNCVHSCYIFWSGSSYVKNLPNSNGNEIRVASPSAVLSSFLHNLETILARCSQLYINCFATLLFIDGCTVLSILLYCPFYPF